MLSEAALAAVLVDAAFFEARADAADVELFVSDEAALSALVDARAAF